MMNNKDIHIGDKVQTLKGTGIVTDVNDAIVGVDLDGDRGSYLFHKEHVWIIEVNNDMSDFRGKRAEMGLYDDAANICEFCSKFDFSTAATEIRGDFANIILALCNTRFSKEQQFNFCPVCGRKLMEENT